MFLVRSRVKEHLSHYFPSSEIKEFEGTDYQYRIYLSEKQFEDFLKTLPDEINYTNFKSSVENSLLKTFYHSIWHFGKHLLGDIS